MHRKLVCLSLLVICGRAFAQDVSMFRGNLQHAGVYESAGVRKFNRVKWQFHTRGMVIGSPGFAVGLVYVGSTDGNFYAMDAPSGALRWKFKTGDVVHASPAIADGMVFIGSWDSYFYAIDAASGQEKWKFKTGEDHDTYNQVGIQSSAAVADGIVYFGCRDSHLYALDAASGEKKWAFSANGSWVVGSPAVREGKV